MSVKSDENAEPFLSPGEAAFLGERTADTTGIAQAQRSSLSTPWEAAANAFRVDLSDAIRPLEHSSDIQQQALKVIAKHFSATRAHFATISAHGKSATVVHEYAPGLLSSVGTHPQSRYGKVVQQDSPHDRIVIVNDIATHPRLSAKQKIVYKSLNIASMVRIRRFRKELAARALVIADSRVRHWTDAELALLDEAGERVWAAIERAEVEEALHHANTQLKESDQRKDEFLAMLSHELRNPLAALQGAVRLLENAQAESRREHYMEILRRQSFTLNRLVDDLLDVSRMTQGVLTLKHEALDFSKLTVTAVENIQPLIDECQLRLDVDIPPKPIKVVGDAVRLEQVLINLLTNAAKYTEPGGKITLSMRVHNGFAEVRISDTGIGISAQEQQRIFALFGQAESARHLSRGGLGIGLSVAKTLISMHKGKIDVVSEGLGKGSTFTVALPLGPAAPQLVAPVDLPASPLAPARKRILVVEDLPDLAETMSLLLQEAGHEVVWVTDGSAALEHVQHFIPDFILMDLGLPVMDGYQLAQRFRAIPALADSVLVAITGYSREQDRERAHKAGFDAHFVKPVAFEELQTFIKLNERS